MLIYRAYEQLTPIYDNVSATGKKYLSQSGHQIFDVFSSIVSGKGAMTLVHKVVEDSQPQCYCVRELRPMSLRTDMGGYRVIHSTPGFYIISVFTLINYILMSMYFFLR